QPNVATGSIKLTGTFGAGSSTITLAFTTALSTGATVSGNGIAPQTTITDITTTADKKSTVITLSKPTTAASSPGGTILTFNTGFNQVPLSSKWWSSLIFPRTKLPDADAGTPQDSQKNQLFALNAVPFTAMVNSNGSIKLTGTFAANSST